MAVLTSEPTEEVAETESHQRRALPRPRRQWTPPLPDDRRTAAVLTLLLGLATLVTRLWDLSYPADRVFDEAYYPPEALEILELGYEYNRGYTFIVHPPLGKWLIAGGFGLFGYDSFGWRLPCAVAGGIGVAIGRASGRGRVQRSGVDVCFKKESK